MAKSTHRGHCQACGNLQMLPSGVLAKHGYTIDHGYFSGVCRGSGEFPYELSCELIGQFIDGATAHLALVEGEQKKLRKFPTDRMMWTRVFYADKMTSRRSRGYVWERVELTGVWEPWSSGGGGSMHYSFIDASGRKQEHQHGKQRWDKDGASDEYLTLWTAQKANQVRAEWLEHEAKSLRRYIAYQEQRVREWKVRELLPVDARDKSGFKPDEAPY